MYANNYVIESIRPGSRDIYLEDQYCPGQNSKILHFDAADWTGYERDILGLCQRGSAVYAKLQNGAGISEIAFELDTSSNIADCLGYCDGMGIDYSIGSLL